MPQTFLHHDVATVSAITRVLVVDDDEVMRDVLSIVLASAGYDVSTAESGDAVLLRLVSTAVNDMPHCILTDLQMPGVCGAELGDRLREVCPATSLRIAMSGSSARAADVSGFDGFLLKPFEVEDFAAAVERATPGAATVDISAAGLSADAPLPALDEAIYAKLAASMPAVQLRQLYMLCLDDAEARIGRMRDAADAADAGLYMREAHAVKGGCGMLGATHLHALAGRMETGALASTPALDEFMAAAQTLRRMLEARS